MEEKQHPTILAILAGVQVDSVDWILVKTENGLEWQRRSDQDVTILNYNNYEKQVKDLKEKEAIHQSELQ